jgi:hypothetical protein
MNDSFWVIEEFKDNKWYVLDWAHFIKREPARIQLNECRELWPDCTFRISHYVRVSK